MRPARKGPQLGLSRIERQALLAMYRRIRRRMLDGLDPELAIHHAYLGLRQLQMDLLLADDQDRNVGELSRLRKRLLGDRIGTAPALPLGLPGANVYDFEVIADTCGELGRELLRRLHSLAHRAAGLLVTGKCLRRARGAFQAALDRGPEGGWRSVSGLAWCLAGLGVPELIAQTILEKFAKRAGGIERSTSARAWATAYRKQAVRAVQAPLEDWRRQLRHVFGLEVSEVELELVRATEEVRVLEAQAPPFVVTDLGAIKALEGLRRMHEAKRPDWRIAWREAAQRVELAA